MLWHDVTEWRRRKSGVRCAGAQGLRPFALRRSSPLERPGTASRPDRSQGGEGLVLPEPGRGAIPPGVRFHPRYMAAYCLKRRPGGGKVPPSTSPAQRLLLTDKPNCLQSLQRPLTTSGPASGGSRCAVGGAEDHHLRAQPRPALARNGPRPPASIYTALF